MTLDEDGRPEVVAYFRSNTIQPPEFAATLDRLGRFYSGRQWAALMAVEDQGGQGALVVNELHRHLDYPNPYMHQQVGTRRSKAGRVFAFPMTMDRRRAVIDRLAKYLAVHDDGPLMTGLYPELRVELGQFVAQETASGNVRYAADVGCHDDLVMSLAIATWVLVEEYEKGSPSAAIVEELIWGKPKTLNLAKYYEARDEHIAEIEAQADLQSITMYSDQIQIPRGYSGRV
jgi:hypothetical protein